MTMQSTVEKQSSRGVITEEELLSDDSQTKFSDDELIYFEEDGRGNSAANIGLSPS
jgi:hypothetical protein